MYTRSMKRSRRAIWAAMEASDPATETMKQASPMTGGEVLIARQESWLDHKAGKVFDSEAGVSLIERQESCSTARQESHLISRQERCLSQGGQDGWGHSGDSSTH